MAETKNRVDQIIDDVKSSWYFRFWLLVWFVCFIMFWVTLGVFGAKSNLAREEPSWRIWIENDTKSGLEFPPFFFKVQWHDVESIEKASCTLDNNMIQQLACPGITDRAKCVEFKTNQEATRRDGWIKCQIQTNGIRSEDRLILFGLDMGHNNTWGDKWDLFVGPNANAHIYLQRSAVKHNSGKKDFDFWQKELVYHSSIFTNNTYNVTIQYRSLDTMHYQEYDYYNGWMAVSDVGGFAFFMSIILSIVMVAVGCVFDNNSRFLNRGSKYSENI